MNVLYHPPIKRQSSTIKMLYRYAQITKNAEVKIVGPSTGEMWTGFSASETVHPQTKPVPPNHNGQRCTYS